ncbi:MAG: hypothetical protein M1826_005883 [Phylliscum demangeonii]|nr:MAG: hypothetical protein M1826_005883 [Phylliscum demangeonii]
MSLVQFHDLPTELVLHVFRACNSVGDVLSLAATCRRFHQVCGPSRRLSILLSAAEEEYGPLDDARQLVTHNDAQPAHVRRHVSSSFALLKQLMAVGRVARKWEEVYPLRRWKYDFEDRRLLTSLERRRLRRAIYRLWLYAKAFHNRHHPRLSRLTRAVVMERTALLHNWSTQELVEMEDVRLVIRDMLENQICPSNGTVQRRYRRRFADSCEPPPPRFNIHLNYPPPISIFHPPFHPTHHPIMPASTKFGSHHKYLPTGWHEPGAEGWGDEVPHYYVVEDMLKLDPAQVMWLKENAPLKGQVELYVKSLGEWFENNGETFGHTLDEVLRDRGSDLEQLKEEIQLGDCGLVVDHRAARW